MHDVSVDKAYAYVLWILSDISIVCSTAKSYARLCTIDANLLFHMDFNVFFAGQFMNALDDASLLCVVPLCNIHILLQVNHIQLHCYRADMIVDH